MPADPVEIEVHGHVRRVCPRHLVKDAILRRVEDAVGIRVHAFPDIGTERRRYGVRDQEGRVHGGEDFPRPVIVIWAERDPQDVRGPDVGRFRDLQNEGRVLGRVWGREHHKCPEKERTEDEDRGDPHGPPPAPLRTPRLR